MDREVNYYQMKIQKNYEIQEDAPPAMSQKEYLEVCLKELNETLILSSHDEKAFQEFFERNPVCLPGAFEIIGTSGHLPHNCALIKQPKIGNLASNRLPDFMWLAQDSTDFCPVMVEIERPSKKLFTGSGQQCADFTQALGQIHEWKALLNQPSVIIDFYDYYDIPDYLRKKNFKPQYCLIYGRRYEYEGNENLNRKRSQLTSDDIVLMSYDRILDMIINCKDDSFVTCTVGDKKYEVANITPTFKYRPGWVRSLVGLTGFYEKIDDMPYISNDRKQFLKERYCYWINLGKQSSTGQNVGIINTLDAE